MTDPSPQLAVIRLGLCTPLGQRAVTSLAAAHAGVQRFVETGVYDREGEPIRASLLARLPVTATRTARIAALAEMAVLDCLAGAERPVQLAVYLALPEAGGELDEAEIFAACAAECGVQLELHGVVRAGRAGLFQLLARLADEVGSPRPVLVIAADSQCDPTTLRRLGEAGRTLADRRDGVVPGEAAAALLLTRGGSAANLRACTIGQVEAAADRVHALADALADTFGRLAAHPDAGGPRPACIVSGQTGEVAEARAFTYAALRRAPLMPEPLEHLRVCDGFGDTGAAAPALALALALHRLRAAPGRALLYASADSGALGACLLDVSADTSEVIR